MIQKQKRPLRGAYWKPFRNGSALRRRARNTLHKAPPSHFGAPMIGFLYIHQTGDATLELYAMGVLKEYHRLGAGKALFAAAYEYARANGYCFIQVKTVQMGKYADYDKTNLFYKSLGFREFELFPTLWDEWNPCQIYVMAVK